MMDKHTYTHKHTYTQRQTVEDNSYSCRLSRGRFVINSSSSSRELCKKRSADKATPHHQPHPLPPTIGKRRYISRMACKFRKHFGTVCRAQRSLVPSASVAVAFSRNRITQKASKMVSTRMDL